MNRGEFGKETQKDASTCLGIWEENAEKCRENAEKWEENAEKWEENADKMGRKCRQNGKKMHLPRLPRDGFVRPAIFSSILSSF